MTKAPVKTQRNDVGGAFVQASKDDKKHISSAVGGNTYRMIRLIAALEDKTMGQVIEDGMIFYANSRKTAINKGT